MHWVQAKRVGRGIGSGSGKTAGRGHKGQKARTGQALSRMVLGIPCACVSSFNHILVSQFRDSGAHYYP